MNLSEQQQSSNTQQNMAIFATLPAEENSSKATTSLVGSVANSSTSAVTVANNPLSLLEVRLTSMSNKIKNLNNTVSMLRTIIAGREERIKVIEQNNAALEQELAASSSSHSQMLDGLADMLNRFPNSDDVSDAAGDDCLSLDTGLLDQTVGTA